MRYYYFLWDSEGAHRLLYRALSEISRKLDKKRNEELTIGELEQNLTSDDLRCVSPPTLAERLVFWSTGLFYRNIRYSQLRYLRMKKINEKALRSEKLEDHEITFAFHYGGYTSGECLTEPLRKILKM